MFQNQKFETQNAGTYHSKAMQLESLKHFAMTLQSVILCCIRGEVSKKVKKTFSRHSVNISVMSFCLLYFITGSWR